DKMHEELNNALQREHEAKLLLHEQEQRLQEVNNRLELPSNVDTDRSQDLNSLSETTEELRRRDRVLNHQKRLLKQMGQDRNRLQECVQEAELALHAAAKDRELIITHMQAVEATLHAVRIWSVPSDLDQALMASAAADMREFCLELPRLQLETPSEEALRGRPEAIAFQVRV
ncbi:CC171 protein, partial [Ptilonorhynchus violaceus]|nr:CC171 protein [Ptilonorhynchus violaceus]